MTSSASSFWPELPYEQWRDTAATLQLWTQIVGKIRLAKTPWLNHSWHVALYVTARGLTTSPIPYGNRSFELQFDFLEHALRIEVNDGGQRKIALQPRSVADFYRALMQAMQELGIPVAIKEHPCEIAGAISFSTDETHASYDADYAQRFWRALVQMDRVFKQFRTAFLGKCSPVHFFWGSFDLAVTRFSGKPAPPREGPAFMRDAYSHEVISHGFWPGGGPILEPVFYAYAAPVPAGLEEAHVEPEAAYYHRDLGEFILPYEAVRTAASPDQAILSFVETTYARAATLAGWDRAALAR